ncbi:DUF1835 domain-containing protein [Psychrobacillus glaciei]|nr:DUF1835 domain-containing protein [Psychrobacillus glaciei]
MTEKIKKVVEHLTEKEAKSLLFQHLSLVQMLEETDYTEEQFLEHMKKEYQGLLRFLSKPRQKNYTTIHIVFGYSPAGSLKVALPREEKIIVFSELFSIGPVHLLHTKKGLEQRRKWLFQHINLDEQYIHEYLENYQQLVAEIKNIPDHMPIYIWTANNAHEQTAARFVLHSLQDKQNDIHLLNVNEAYQNHWSTPPREHYPLGTGEVAPEKLKIIYEANKCGQPLTKELRNKLAKEWEKLSKTTEVLRIWGDDEIKNVPENYFDTFIVDKARYLHSEQTKPEFMKSARLIGEVLGHVNQYIGDEFIEYRLRQLILQGIFEIEGVPKAMRFYSVKLKEEYNSTNGGRNKFVN